MPTLTREELYVLVWSEPIQKIAPRYGLSDRGFGKLCARYEIPVPPRGWWAKRAAGKRVRQTPLPPLNDPYRQKIRLAEKARETAADASKAEVHPLVAFEQDPVNRISVPATGDLTNTLVLKTERLLKRSKREADGRIAVPSGGLYVHTSRELHERALRIMQGLFTALETRRFPVTTTAEGRPRHYSRPSTRVWDSGGSQEGRASGVVH
jgi:hypothetical protein